jgi:hypothetical protein
LTCKIAVIRPSRSAFIPGDDAATLEHYHGLLVKTLVRSRLSPIGASLF